MAASLIGAALWYVKRGHLVFPLHPRSKIPATKHGFKNSSMDPDTIRAWWTKNPAYNIGIATGHLFDVIDVDGEAGIRSIAQIEDEGHLPPIIGRVVTHRGFHLYVRPTGDGCLNRVRPGIDYKGIGGYVVAPPSTHENGSTYRWTAPLSVSAADTFTDRTSKASAMTTATGS